MAHVAALVSCPSINSGSFEEYNQLYKMLITGLRNTGQYGAGPFLTSLMVPKLSTRARE